MKAPALTSARTTANEPGQAPAPTTAVVRFGVVVLNWNRAADTIECLRSLLAADPAPARVVVVDNGSMDDSCRRIHAWLESAGVTFEGHGGDGVLLGVADQIVGVTILPLSENRGYSGGNNVGLSRLQGEPSLTHFLLLNNDAAVAPDYFAEAARAIAQVPQAGVLSGTIYWWDDPRHVWYAGGKAHPFRALFSHEHDVPPDGSPRETEFVTGCAMLVARPVLRSVGLLPECYFPGYMEDGEFCWRARAAGFPLIYAPKMSARHRVGASHGPALRSPLVTFSQNRHRVFFARRNLRGLTRLVALCYMLASKPIRGLIEVLHGRPAIGWAVIRGTAAGFSARLG